MCTRLRWVSPAHDTVARVVVAASWVLLSACGQSEALASSKPPADATPMVPIIVYATPATPMPGVTEAPPSGVRTPTPNSRLRRSTGPANATPLPRSTPAASASSRPVGGEATDSAVTGRGQTPATPRCVESTGSLSLDSMPSAVLAEPLNMRVYLPPCYANRADRYPTLYLLPGLGSDRNPWLDIGITRTLDGLISSGKIPPMVVVFPQTDESAGDQSRFVFSGGGAGSWEEFVVRELVPWIEAKFNVRNDAPGRAIGGISRGGYWSVEIGLRHPDLFATIGGHSPAISADLLVGVPDDFSMISLATSLPESRGQRYFLDSGDEDPMQYPVERLNQALTENLINSTAHIGKGGHDEAYWESQLTSYLGFYGSGWN